MTTNAELLARRNAAVPRGVATATPIFAARAKNSELWDEEGNRYVDFAGGIAVLNTGHCHPKVIAAVTEQLGAFTHTAFQVVAYKPYIELAERLNALVPISGEKRSIFFSTGAEAVENAIKVARAATGRQGVIAFTGAFHGRTTLTMAMTGKVAPYKRAFGPAAANVHHVPFPIEHYGVTVEDSLRALRFLFAADLDPSQTAAIILEPVQGEGGFHAAPPALMTALRSICDEHGIVLIADEVQSGFGRTGKMFGAEHWPVEPDMMTVAKSMGGGFPISGLVARASIIDGVEPGGLGGTYAGSPIACAAALAVLEVFEEEKLLERANVIGDRIKSRLEALQRRNDLRPMAHIRGLGAMIAFDIVKERGSADPDGAGAKAVTAAALDAGLILLSCGTSGETIRILVPLTVEDEVLEEGLGKLEQALAV